MKESKLRKLIREVIKEQMAPLKGDRPINFVKPPKPDVSSLSDNPNYIGLATPIIGYNCNENGGCEILYDIPMNAGMQAEFANHQECVASGCAWYPSGPESRGGRAVPKNIKRKPRRR